MTIKKGTPRLILDIGTYRFANLLIQQHGEWRSYYDEETSELVRTQERFIVERFGYKGPSG